MRTARLAAVIGGAAASAACGSLPHVTLPHPHVALPTFDEGPAAAYNGVCHGATCKSGYDASRNQYFDARRRRYYFFDRRKQRYFWADGEPKT